MEAIMGEFDISKLISSVRTSKGTVPKGEGGTGSVSNSGNSDLISQLLNGKIKPNKSGGFEPSKGEGKAGNVSSEEAKAVRIAIQKSKTGKDGNTDIKTKDKTGTQPVNNKKTNSNTNIAVDEINDKNNVKVEKHTYTTKSGQVLEGKLCYKKDGSIKFVGSDVQNAYIASFASEDAMKKNMPDKVVQGYSGNLITEETSYKYNSEGKTTEVTKMKQGVVVYEEKNNDQGRPLSIKNYSADGKTLESEIVFQDKDENHRTYISYGKDHEIKATGEETYENDKIASRVIYDKDHNKTKEMQFKDGKIDNLNTYKDGKLEKTLVYFPEGGIKSQTTYDKDGNVVKHNEVELAPDGKFGSAAQVGQGDCYLLAAINALRETPEGQQQLESLISISTDENGKKVYTIKLPGAQYAADSLSKDKNVDPNKMYITGTYTFTEDDVEKLIKQSGTKYSLGDADVLLLEAAFEQYRQECNQTVRENNLKADTESAGLTTSRNGNNVLAGGLAHDSTFVLTGKPSKVYFPQTRPVASLDEDALKEGKALVSKPSPELVSAAPSEYDGPVQRNKSQFKDMLDDIMEAQANGNESIVATAGFSISKDGKEVGGHAFTIKKVTEDTVVLINPWHPDQELTMSRKDFEETANYCNYTDLKKDTQIKEKETEKIGDKHNDKDSHPHGDLSKDEIAKNKKIITDGLKRITKK